MDVYVVKTKYEFWYKEKFINKDVELKVTKEEYEYLNGKNKHNISFVELVKIIKNKKK